MSSSLLTWLVVMIGLVAGCATKDLRVQEFRVAADTRIQQSLQKNSI